MSSGQYELWWEKVLYECVTWETHDLPFKLGNRCDKQKRIVRVHGESWVFFTIRDAARCPSTLQHTHR